jgi:hypothetical protein
LLGLVAMILFIVTERDHADPLVPPAIVAKTAVLAPSRAIGLQSAPRFHLKTAAVCPGGPSNTHLPSQDGSRGLFLYFSASACGQVGVLGDLLGPLQHAPASRHTLAKAQDSTSENRGIDDKCHHLRSRQYGNGDR